MEEVCVFTVLFNVIELAVEAQSDVIPRHPFACKSYATVIKLCDTILCGV